MVDNSMSESQRTRLAIVCNGKEKTMTDKEKLIARYPEGIPAWMWDRDYTLDHIDSLMRIRREAFKIFARRPKEGKDHA